MMFTQEQHDILMTYRPLYDNVPYDERAAELTGEDEKIIEKIYNQWRGGNLTILSCDECVNEAFDRLMRECIKWEEMMNCKPVKKTSK